MYQRRKAYVAAAPGYFRATDASIGPIIDALDIDYRYGSGQLL